MLTPSQKKFLASLRKDQFDAGIELYAFTGAGAVNNDAYARQTYVHTLQRRFSGAISWGRFIDRRDTEGGYYEVSDIAIAASRDEKSYVQQRDFYLKVDGVELRVKRLVDLEDTREILMYCEKRS